jgi:hypothetical protein
MFDMRTITVYRYTDLEIAFFIDYRIYFYSKIYSIQAVFRIRIHRIHMFLGLPDPDPLVRGMDPDSDPALDPDPSIIMQK